jgi:hypothetical protein
MQIPANLTPLDQKCLLIDLALRTFPEDCVRIIARKPRAINGDHLWLTVHEAKALLCKVPIPWAQGFFVDGDTIPRELFNTEWERESDAFHPRPMHRECFIRLGNQAVGMGRERAQWLDIIAEWPPNLVCDRCGQTAPPPDEVQKRTRWQSPNQPRYVMPLGFEPPMSYRTLAIVWIVFLLAAIGIGLALRHMPPEPGPQPPDSTVPF